MQMKAVTEPLKSGPLTTACQLRQEVSILPRAISSGPGPISGTTL